MENEDLISCQYTSFYFEKIQIILDRKHTIPSWNVSLFWAMTLHQLMNWKDIELECRLFRPIRKAYTVFYSS